MTNDLTRPEPLVPAEVSMGNNDWFPLHFRRMRKSRWWKTASDLARSRSVDMWGLAYEEVPAGSLPDDDAELADHAGFGRDIRAWLEVKDEIMAAWVLCSDGRWYHPTLCEVILEAWEKGSVKRKTEAQRKAEYRARVRQQKGDVPRDKPVDVPAETDVSHGTGPKNGGTVPVEERRGQDRTEQVTAIAVVDAEAPTLDLVVQQVQTDAEKVVSAWNAMADHVNQFQPDKMKLAKVASCTGSRATWLDKRLEEHGLDALLEAIITVSQSQFLRGLEGRGSSWKADFDFLMQAKSCRKVVEMAWPRNITPEMEAAYGSGTSVDRRSLEHSERIRRNHDASMAGLD